jgi:excisionase family DNA binding protein
VSICSTAISKHATQRTGRGPSTLARPPPAYAHRINHAAQILDVSRSQIYNLLGDGKLESVRVGAIQLITDRSLRKLLGIEE